MESHVEKTKERYEEMIKIVKKWLLLLKIKLYMRVLRILIHLGGGKFESYGADDYVITKFGGSEKQSSGENIVYIIKKES